MTKVKECDLTPQLKPGVTNYECSYQYTYISAFFKDYDQWWGKTAKGPIFLSLPPA
jgi:hypothetical protein